MNFISSFMLGISLSMDTFAVALCKGLAVGKVKFKHILNVGAWFGCFQILMPLIGFYTISFFNFHAEKSGKWLAFLILFTIGIGMIHEAFAEKEKPADASFGVKTMLIMSIATSFDALAAGAALAINGDKSIRFFAALTGIITFFMSAAGIKIGSIFGEKHRKNAEIFGGIILILTAIKIFTEQH